MIFSRKGKAFERRVLALITREVESGHLGIDPKRCLILHNAPYYSHERKSNIFTDISIEIFISGSKVPSILWIWECKNLSRPVPVDDLEEFHSKLQQIGSDRTKGTMISAGAYQKGAIEYASFHGIGLSRLLPPNNIKFVSFNLGEEYFPGLETHLEHETAQALLNMEFWAKMSSGDDPDLGLYAITSDFSVVAEAGIGQYMIEELSEWGVIPVHARPEPTGTQKWLSYQRFKQAEESDNDNGHNWMERFSYFVLVLEFILSVSGGVSDSNNLLQHSSEKSWQELMKSYGINRLVRRVSNRPVIILKEDGTYFKTRIGPKTYSRFHDMWTKFCFLPEVKRKEIIDSAARLHARRLLPLASYCKENYFQESGDQVDNIQG